MTNTRPGKCPKCQGALITDDGHRKCINCGWTGKTHREVHLFLQANKPEILADFEQLGRQKTMEKWGVASSVLDRLIKKSKPIGRPAAGGSATPPDWTISWKYLMLLDDEDYADIWRVLGEIERRRRVKEK